MNLLVTEAENFVQEMEEEKEIKEAEAVRKPGKRLRQLPKIQVISLIYSEILRELETSYCNSRTRLTFGGFGSNASSNAYGAPHSANNPSFIAVVGSPPSSPF